MCLKCLLVSQTCPDSPIKHFIIWPLLFLFKPFSLHFIILHLEGPYAEPPNFLQLCFMFLNESPHRAVQVIPLYLIDVICHLSSMLQFISCHTTAILFFKTNYEILLPRSLVQICYNYEKKASLYLTYTCYPGDFIFSTALTFHCPLAKKDVHIFPNDETLDEMYIYMNKSLKRLSAENVLKCWKNNYV